MAKRKFVYESNLPATPRYICRHLAEMHFTNGTDSLDYVCGQNNIRILTDEQESDWRAGKQLPINDGNLSSIHRGTASLSVCQDCSDAKEEALAAKKLADYIAKYGVPPEEQAQEPAESQLEEAVAA